MKNILILFCGIWIFGKNKPDYFKGIGFTTNLFARVHIIIKINMALSNKFENSSVLFSGRANADLINTIDSLSYNLIK